MKKNLGRQGRGTNYKILPATMVGRKKHFFSNRVKRLEKLIFAEAGYVNRCFP